VNPVRKIVVIRVAAATMMLPLLSGCVAMAVPLIAAWYNYAALGLGRFLVRARPSRSTVALER